MPKISSVPNYYRTEALRHNPAHNISGGNHEKAYKHVDRPDARHMVVEHIRDTVLRTAEDESHDAEEDRGVLGDLVLVIFKSVDSNKYEDVTQDAEQEQAQQAVICLYPR